MEKRWRLNEQAPEKAVAELSQVLNNLSPVLCNILVQRGISTFEQAKDFFRPSLSHLHDPFLMKDMDKAVARLEKAIAQHEKIIVYGDYDVDGTTSVAMVYSFLHSFYPQLEYYIPDRYTEGYGISIAGIDYAKKSGATLIIALDCGIKAIEKIAYANLQGVDFIICDHHRPGDTLPSAAAVLDPKRSDCPYPYKELSGCGVGFKLLQAYAQKNKLPFSKLEECLDFLAISICADIVPITGENRVFTYFGLQRLNTLPRPGIKVLKRVSNEEKPVQIAQKPLTVSDVVFTFAPRINAAGRIENASSAVKALLSANEKEADEFVYLINKQNANRKELDKTVTAEARSMIESSGEYSCRKSTVLFCNTWHKGVVGIVASRLIEQFYKPTIILTEANGMVSGSARSVKGFDVYNAIDACSELLEQFGGHMYAAGLTMKPDNVEKFILRFEEVVAATITDEMLVPEEEVDAELKLHEISPHFVRVLNRMAPFGPGNMKPVFLARNLLARTYRVVGSEHLRMDVYQPEHPACALPSIGYGFARYFEQVNNNQSFHMLFHVEENEWNGNRTIQLKIVDIKSAN